MLEEFAEDNASLLSSASAVNRVLNNLKVSLYLYYYQYVFLVA